MNQTVINFVMGALLAISLSLTGIVVKNQADRDAIQDKVDEKQTQALSRLADKVDNISLEQARRTSTIAAVGDIAKILTILSEKLTIVEQVILNNKETNSRIEKQLEDLINRVPKHKVPQP